MRNDLTKKLKEVSQKLKNDETIEEFLRYIANSENNKNDAASVISWLYEKIVRDISLEEDILETPAKNFRILSDKEISRIGLQNYNYLLHFYNVGLLKNKDFDYILEQIMFIDEDDHTNDYLNALILSIFLDINDVTLPGSRLLLNSSDTIN